MLKILNPYIFCEYSRQFILPIFMFMVILLGLGLYQALIISPKDYQQGEMVRIMYIHVPSAWMALGIYSFIAICSFLNLIWKIKLTYILALASAPVGAAFAFITLITGSLWGKPIWGTWWVWDARLTSMLVLFLLYLSYIAVSSSGEFNRAEKPAGVIALIGFINVPIVKFSVDIWYSLHQPASIIRLGGPAVHSTMLLPLFLMFGALIMYFLLVLIFRSQTIIFKMKNS